MIKVTIANVTKLSEDALYMALNELKETDDMFQIIDSELNRRVDLHASMLQKRQEAQLESLKVTQAIQAEIAAIFEGFKGKKTLILIENLGQEMVEDYTICEETFTVLSKLEQGFEHNPTSWECGSIEQARGKVARLIYNRLYNKFMRDATDENLELLKRVLGG